MAVMSKTFRAYDMNQQLLLPPDLRQWLPDDHLSIYVSDVIEALDLAAIIKKYEEGGRSCRAAIPSGADGEAVDLWILHWSDVVAKAGTGYL